MAKKETIPTIINTPEALTAKMAAMKEKAVMHADKLLELLETL